MTATVPSHHDITTIAADTTAGEHWLTHQSKGWGRLGAFGTLLIFGGVFSGMAVLVLVPAPVNLPVTAVYAVLYYVAFMVATTRNIHGDTRLQLVLLRSAHARSQSKGHNQYVSGPRTRFGTWRLPGILAATSCSVQHDATGAEYAMIYTPATGDHAVTFRAHPDGASLLAQADRDTARDAWDKAGLTFLCTEADCVQMQVVIDTAADPGIALQQRLRNSPVDDAPALSRTLIEELAQEAPKGASVVESWVTLTFAGARTKSPAQWKVWWNRLLRRPPIDTRQTKTEKTMAASLASRLPAIAEQLSSTGAGPCPLVGAVDLSTAVRVAFDPQCADTVARARAEDRPWQMRWDSVGPPSAENAPTYYRSCGALHRTSTATGINGVMYDETMTAILEPHPKLTRKRVCVTFTLHDRGTAAVITQSDVNTAQWKLNTTSAQNPAQDLTNARVSAGVTAAHRSKGAGVVDVSVQVTCTILDPTRPRGDDESDEDYENRPGIDTLDAVMASIGPAAALQFRDENGVQATAFATTLMGPGIRLSELVAVPVWAGKAL